MKYRIGQIIFILFSTAWLVSCTPEWKMAKAYIASKPDISIVVLPTNVVFKNNLKMIDGVDTTRFSEIQMDSVRLSNSSLLKEISDSIFLETFTNSLLSEFDALGYTVFTESELDSFLFLKTPAYIFNIAQIQVEETYKVHEDREELSDKVYYKKTNLDALTFNFWFELSKMNAATENTKLFFVSETITDLMNGYFTENAITGQVNYRYKINEVDTSIIYRYCSIYGQRYAGYSFDYLMNKSIEAKWPASKKRRFYMHYKRYNHSLVPTWKDKFTLMDQ